MITPIPAFIICGNDAVPPPVAALPLLDRLVVALHRAGCQPITLVGAADAPWLPRATALGADVRHATDSPSTDGWALVTRAQVLTQTGDVGRVIEARGVLEDREGELLPLGMVSGGTVPTEVEAALSARPRVRAEGVAQAVPDAATARAAGRRLWASLRSSSDGTVDRFFNRPVSRLVTRLLLHTPITPNQISVVSILVGLASGIGFAQTDPRVWLWAALALQLSAIIDCMDGDLARLLFKESALGKWLDLAGDQVVHLGVFLGLGIGQWRAGSAAPVLALGASAALGVLIAFAVVVRGTRVAQRAGGTSSLQRLIDATTNRDFSVLLILLCLAGRLEWFLWMAGVGVHLFWLTALALQWRGPRTAEEPMS